jgi:hypothetical protein
VEDLGSLGDAWLKVIVPDGEVHRRGDALVYLASEPGRKAVQVFSIPLTTR